MRIPWILFPIVVGFALAMLLYGPVISPAATQWLHWEGDSLMHYMGWAFFIREPWQWPPGAIAGLGDILSSSVVFSDSIPLLALPLKALLPNATQWQYLGFFSALSCVLNVTMAAVLAQRLGSDRWVALLVGIVVALLPHIVLRGLAAHGHTALTAAWIYLGAFWLFLLPFNRATKRWWAAWLTVALCVHFYLFFVVGILWSCWLLLGLRSEWPRSRAVALSTAGYAAMTLCLVTLAMWLAGYFVGSKAMVQSGGFGHFSAELLTFFNPRSLAWFQDAKLLPSESLFFTGWLSPISGQYEGQTYAGLGVFCLVVIAMWVGWHKPSDSRLRMLFVVCCVLFLLSLGNTVVVGTLQVRYPLDALLGPLGSVLRSAGRFALPLLLLVVVWSASQLRYVQRPALRWGIALAVVVVQLVDVSPGLNFVRQQIANKPNPSLRDSFHVFREVDDPAFWMQFHRLVAVPEPDLGYLKPYMWVALEYNLRLNIAALARAENNLLAMERERLVSELQSGILKTGQLYLTQDTALGKVACEHAAVRCRAIAGVTLIHRGEPKSPSAEVPSKQ
jgi:hypothetical protein